MPREYAHDSALTNHVEQEMRPSLIEILVKLSVKISSRFSNIKELEKRFGFLCKFEAYINDGDIHFKEQLSQINIKCTVLAKLYPHDLNSEELFSDLKDVILLSKRDKVNGEQLDCTPQELI